MSSMWTYFLVLFIIEPKSGFDAFPPIQERASDNNLVHEPEVESKTVHTYKVYRIGDDLKKREGGNQKYVI